MLKAVFFDMDKTLCNTSHADNFAMDALYRAVAAQLHGLDPSWFCDRYLEGIYKNLENHYPPLAEYCGDELGYRLMLIRLIAMEKDISISTEQVRTLQGVFDEARLANFDFFTGVKDKLIELRKHYTLVLITNGPVFSQYPKLAAVNMSQFMDHILVGGDHPEEKPAESIFIKAMTLAKVDACEAIHVGDSFDKDIQGASSVNMPSIWVADNDQQAKVPGVTANYRVANPLDVFAIIYSHAQQESGASN